MRSGKAQNRSDREAAWTTGFARGEAVRREGQAEGIDVTHPGGTMPRPCVA